MDTELTCDNEAKNDVERHLEMIIHKHKRCQEWVSTQVPKHMKSSKIKRNKTCQEFSEIDEELSETELEYGDDVLVTNKRRKAVCKENISQKFKCEWKGCGSQNFDKLKLFCKHVSDHINEVPLNVKDKKIRAYTCLWESCFFETSNEKEIIRHIYYHSYHAHLKAAAIQINHLWKFSFCKLDEDTRNCLPDLLTSFCCEWSNCNFTHDNFQFYILHVNQHYLDINFRDKKQWVYCQWRGCSSTCTKITFKVHLRKHTNEKVAACPTCGAMFATNTKYMDHCIRKMPAKVESNRCKYCWKYFTNVRLLTDHMRYHINEHKCPFCEMTCSTPSRLTSHISYRHLNERHFKCSICSFSAKTIDDYNSHLIIHDSSYQFHCKENKCKFSCSKRYALKNHYKSVHEINNERVYACHLCDKVYSRGNRLTVHLKSVHNIEKLPGYTRLRYMQNLNGNFELQKERYDFIELQNNSQHIQGDIKKLASQRYLIKPLEYDANECRKFELEKVENNDGSEVDGDVQSSGDDGRNVNNEFSARIQDGATQLKENESERFGSQQDNDILAAAVINSSIHEGESCEKLITLEEVDEHGNVIRCELIKEKTISRLPDDGNGQIIYFNL